MRLVKVRRKVILISTCDLQTTVTNLECKVGGGGRGWRYLSELAADDSSQNPWTQKAEGEGARKPSTCQCGKKIGGCGGRE
ncbi:hypothetical protein E2C01_090884 [Portunus trituberculatus]|uniref:Uncharacterized protein n=1 Tax=Portunus trituberculatus TaxID=210409 RepID=A0A5B7JM33_PORTR|nr:hypothetical protein [Portunus trituberculatus]